MDVEISNSKIDKNWISTVPIALVLIFSGAASIMFEVLWARSFSLILGSTVKSSSVVLASFLLGLGMGAYLFGRYSHKIKNYLKAYVYIELGIGTSALITSLSIHSYRAEILSIAGDPRDLFFMFKSIFFVIGLTLIPNILMGATLPVLLSAVKKSRIRNKFIPFIYGINTLGAATGTLFIGLYSIRQHGMNGSIYIAFMFNLLAAGILFISLGRLGPYFKNEASEIQLLETIKPISYVPQWLLDIVAFLSGFIILSLELVWMQYCNYLLGDRAFSFSILLFCILILLFLGSLCSHKILDKFWDKKITSMSLLLFTATIFMSLSPIFAQYIYRYQEDIISMVSHSDYLYITYKVFIVFILTLPIFLTLGLIFPLCLSFSKQVVDDTGLTVGRCYLINSIGSFIGALGTGYISIHYLGFSISLALVIILSAVLSIVLLKNSELSKTLKYAFSSILIVYTIIVSLVSRSSSFLIDLSRQKNKDYGMEVLYEKENEYGLFQAVKDREGFGFTVNNLSTTDSYIDGYGNAKLIFWGASHLERPRKGLALGVGLGIGTSIMAEISSFEKVDAVDINESVFDYAKFCENNERNKEKSYPKKYCFKDLKYISHPKVKIHVTDGRHFLAKSNEKYDLIVVNMPDALDQNGSKLFSQDFYKLVRKHLTSQGILSINSWPPALKFVYPTLATEFKYIRNTPKWVDDEYIVMASNHPFTLKNKTSKLFFENDHLSYYLDKLQIKDLDSLKNAINENYLDKKDLLKLDFKEFINSDEFPRLEFLWEDNIQDFFGTEWYGD